MQLKDTIPFACGESLTTGITTVGDRKTANVVVSYDKEGGDVESEEGADVPQI